MWKKTFTKVYQVVSVYQIWAAWADTKNWPSWDLGLEFCTEPDRFVDGASFALKVKGGPKVEIILSDVVESERFTDHCCFLGAKMYDVREVRGEPEGVRVTMTTYVTGPLAFLWVQLVAKGVAKSVPEQTDNMISYLRESNV